MPEIQTQKTRDEKLSSSNLNEYLNRELIRNLTELNTIISVEQGNRLSKNSFSNAGAIIEDIHDLAMVHGFDSIEAIAEKLASAALQLNAKRTDRFNEALGNIRSGTKAILDILKISSDQATPGNELIGNSGVKQKKSNKQSKETSDQFFDIKEIDSLMELIEKQQELIQENQNEDSPNGLEQAFEEIFREEALESLTQFEESIENLKSGKTRTEFSLRIKSAVLALRDIAQSYEVSALSEPFTKLIEFCESELRVGALISPVLLQILGAAGKAIRDFIVGFPGTEFNHQEFARLFDLQVEEPHADISPGANEQAGSEDVEPRIRAKISANKEEIRRRWILNKH